MFHSRFWAIHALPLKKTRITSIDVRMSYAQLKEKKMREHGDSFVKVPVELTR